LKPIGPMMREHRLIERMLGLMDRQLERIKAGQDADPVLIETAVDFFRTYADRTHHGKEEEIYFRDLAKKDISDEHRTIMNDLIEEHAYARGEVRALLASNQRHASGEPGEVEEIVGHLEKLVNFYPGHIEKEDKHFFFPTQEYFSKEEDEAMLQEFEDFDARMIHEKYTAVVERFDGDH
jgi:hemerythrin-like domain-containing protein